MASGGKAIQGHRVAGAAYDFHVLYTVGPARNVEICAAFALRTADRDALWPRRAPDSLFFFVAGIHS